MERGPEKSLEAAERTPIREAVVEAELLLAYAADHGVGLPEDLVASLVAAKQLLADDLADPATYDRQAAFWNARDRLAKAVQPVTAASLRASAQTGPLAAYRSLLGVLSRSRRAAQPLSPAERSVLWFRFLAFVALLSLLTVQVYWVVGSRVLGETAEIIQQVQKYRAETATLDADSPQAQRLEAARMALEDEMAMRYAVLESWNRVWAFPFHAAGAMRRPAVDSPGYDDLQRARMVGEFASQSIERYLLPLLYGWLGACLYVLRMLARDIKALSYTPEQDMLYRLRIYMGSLAGLIVVWFLPAAPASAGAKSLSVFAVALLVGYSIDLLFALLDRIIATFTTAR